MASVRPSLIIALVPWLLAAGWCSSASAQTTTTTTTTVPPSIGNTNLLNLQGQLEKGLKARRPVEFAYIAQVVTLVENGTLPRNLVDTTFGYARSKHRPMQHFEFALQLRAQKAGITVTPIEKIVSPQR